MEATDNKPNADTRHRNEHNKPRTGVKTPIRARRGSAERGERDGAISRHTKRPKGARGDEERREGEGKGVAMAEGGVSPFAIESE